MKLIRMADNNMIGTWVIPAGITAVFFMFTEKGGTVTDYFIPLMWVVDPNYRTLSIGEVTASPNYFSVTDTVTTKTVRVNGTLHVRHYGFVE